MESEDPEVIQLELKYCERCGGLWLRRRGTQEVYCGRCAVEILELPGPCRLTSRPRMPVNHKVELRTEEYAAICGQGGNA